jgi:hypothetical protein
MNIVKIMMLVVADMGQGLVVVHIMILKYRTVVTNTVVDITAKVSSHVHVDLYKICSTCNERKIIFR